MFRVTIRTDTPLNGVVNSQLLSYILKQGKMKLLKSKATVGPLWIVKYCGRSIGIVRKLS